MRNVGAALGAMLPIGAPGDPKLMREGKFPDAVSRVNENGARTKFTNGESPSDLQQIVIKSDRVEAVGYLLDIALGL